MATEQWYEVLRPISGHKFKIGDVVNLGDFPNVVLLERQRYIRRAPAPEKAPPK